MKRIIRAFKKLSNSNQQDLYTDYSKGSLERTIFPYNGGNAEGVIYKTEDCIYLVPISSILEVKSTVGETEEEEKSSNVDISEVIGEKEVSDEE